MIPSLTQCSSHVIIYQFQLSKFKEGEFFMIPSLTQCNSYIIIYQFTSSKKGINKLSNCNNYLRDKNLRDIFLSLGKPDIFCLNFLHRQTELSLNWGNVAAWKDVEKKKEQTSEQSFVNAVIDIWMPEMNGMIHSKTSFKCLR